MNMKETAVSQNIQQAVIERLALLSPEKQQRVLAFAEEMVRPDTAASEFRAMFEEAARNVPDEAWNEIPADASSNIDNYLNKRLER